MNVALLLLQVATNAQLGYRFTLPSGFVAFPAGRSQPDVVDCWTEIAAPSSGGALILCIQRMHATMGRERLKQADLPPQVRLIAMKWKGFEIDGIRTDTVQAGFPVAAYAAQVNEAFTLSKGEAPILELNAAERGHIRVRGWDRADYSVETCKVAAAEMAMQDSGLPVKTDSAAGYEPERVGTIVGWIAGIGIGVLVVRMVVARRRSRSV